jgi:hypothetical protein
LEAEHQRQKAEAEQCEQQQQEEDVVEQEPNTASATTPYQYVRIHSTGLSTGGTDGPQARFMAHVTFSEDAPIEAGSRIVKAWRVRNVGTDVWPEGCLLVNVGGRAMGADTAGVPVPAAAPGEDVDVEVRLTAPLEAGRYAGYYRLVTPDGVRFGHRLWVDLWVTPVVRQEENSNAATVLATLTAQEDENDHDDDDDDEQHDDDDDDDEQVDVSPAPSASAPVLDENTFVFVRATAAAEEDLDGLEAEEEENDTFTHPEYQPQIAQLQGMGFTDLAAVVSAIEGTHGDIGAAVNRLLQ